jgi:hypothetical protein
MIHIHVRNLIFSFGLIPKTNIFSFGSFENGSERTKQTLKKFIV